MQINGIINILIFCGLVPESQLLQLLYLISLFDLIFEAVRR